jgi:hypothetical protein
MNANREGQRTSATLLEVTARPVEVIGDEQALKRAR